MMIERDNVEVVKQLYSAIGQGNLPSALELLSEKVDWRSPVTRTESSKISWSRQRIGRKEVHRTTPHTKKGKKTIDHNL